MDFCRHLLLAAVLALLLAGCASAANLGAGSFDPSRVVQLSWRPR
jgi:prolyl 4-hydroxylase